MASNGSSSSPKSNPKKANLMDPHSIKHLLNESVSEIVTGRGYTEDVRLSNIRLLVGTVIIAIALLAQFYRKKFPENKDFLIGCITLYPSKPFSCTSIGEEIFFFSVFLQCNLSIGNSFITIIILRSLTPFWQVYHLQWIVAVDHLQKGEECDPFHLSSFRSFNSTGLIVSSKLPRFSDLYTLSVTSADPKSVSANKPVHFTKSVTKWFTRDGILVEGLFWKDVSKLIDDYSGDSRKNK